MSLKRLCFVLLCSALFLGIYAGAEQPEWERRPLEIINGRLPKPHCNTLWNAVDGGIEGWQVNGDAVLSLSNDFMLWNDNVAKLTVNKPGRITLVPPAPIKVEEGTDGLELWLYGFKSGRGTCSFEVTDADGKKHIIKPTGNSSRWANSSWWGACLGRFPQKAVAPLEVSKIMFDIPAGIPAGEAMYFDFLGNYKFQGMSFPDTAKWNNPFPNHPYTILPTPSDKSISNSAQTFENRYVFTCEGANGKVEYSYVPETGTLSDLTVSLNGETSFKPMVNGGIHATVNGVVFKPGDKDIVAKLDSVSFENNVLKTTWTLSKNDASVSYMLAFESKNCSLMISAESDNRDISAFDCGYTKGTADPRLINLTYLNYRWDYPRILATNDYFVSVFPDWYTSEASEVVDGGARLGLDGAKVLGDDSARILGGSLYIPRARGVRNAMHERFFLTVASDLNSVLPNIPNPRSDFFDETKTLIYSTRMYESLTVAETETECELWKLLADYGLKDMFVRYHGHQFRTPVRSNRICRSLDAFANVGEEAYKKMFANLKTVVRRLGPYEDNRIIHPLAPEFNYDILALNANGTFVEGWDCQFQPSPVSQMKLEADFVPKFIEKYGWNACYFDEVTNTPPWGLIDYNTVTPDGGKYLDVLRNYGLVALSLRKMYNGPIWSEGNAAMFWAGLLDTNYAQCNAPDAFPVVDYKLHKINKLENLNGYDLTRVSSSVDYMVSAQIVNGNMGHIWAEGAMYLGSDRLKHMDAALFCKTIKSYYMMRQLQELYAGVEVEAIEYECGGRMVTSTEMFRQKLANEGKVYERYANGLEIWVNRNDKENWTVDVDGEEYVLPPYGYAAFMPGTILEYSALVNDNRVDYSQGPLYTYVDGRGSMTEFPEIKAANAYVMFKNEKGIELIPVPFVSEESVNGIDASKVTPLDRNGKPLGETRGLDVIDAGKARFNISKDVFKYLLE